jgi:soluble lytic murein transglycosylase-like protein
VTDFVNPCGGKRWAIDPDGMIEVEGEGYPVVDAGSAAYLDMTQTWQNWGGMFQAASAQYGVPVAWLLAVATMETGYLSADPTKQAQAVSPVGAIGVMQIMPFNATSFGLSSSDDLYDPQSNINVGAQILAKANANANNGGLPGISAIYNSGKLCTTDPNRNEWMLLADADYPRHVIEWNNTAIQAGLVSAFGPTTYAVLGAAIGVALGLAVLAHR